MVINVINESVFKESQRNGILSKEKKHGFAAMGFVASKYTTICPSELLERIDAAKSSFIQTDSMLRKNNLLRQVLGYKYKNNKHLESYDA